MEPQTLSSPNRTSCCNSPKFEFWMLQNPYFPQPNLLSTDELFVDGFLFPNKPHLPQASNFTTSNPPPPPRSPRQSDGRTFSKRVIRKMQRTTTMKRKRKLTCWWCGLIAEVQWRHDGRGRKTEARGCG